jgi:hypothetical protein
MYPHAIQCRAISLPCIKVSLFEILLLARLKIVATFVSGDVNVFLRSLTDVPQATQSNYALKQPLVSGHPAVLLHLGLPVQSTILQSEMFLSAERFRKLEHLLNVLRKREEINIEDSSALIGTTQHDRMVQSSSFQ